MAYTKKIWYTRQSDCIEPLRRLIEEQNHRTIVAWALDCAHRPLALFEKRVTQDLRPREALVFARRWAQGEIKMPEARRAILAAHQAAGEAGKTDPIAEALARAVGHACASVHTETHAIGLALYYLTAAVSETTPKQRDAREQEEMIWLIKKLLDWQAHLDRWDAPWAEFLLRDIPNREKLLHEKRG